MGRSCLLPGFLPIWLRLEIGDRDATCVLLERRIAWGLDCWLGAHPQRITVAAFEPLNKPNSTLEKIREARHQEAVVWEEVKRVRRFGIGKQPGLKLKL